MKQMVKVGNEKPYELVNKNTYKKRYEQGYGLQFPDSHIIRIYEYFLKHELKLDGSNHEKMLDFGCGNGTHPVYFAEKGFEVYGVDISPYAIQYCQSRLPNVQDNFKVIEPCQPISDIFPVTFDVILANQSLYFLADSHLKAALQDMHTLLNENGIVIFTMMGTKHYFHGFVKEENSDGMKTVHIKTDRLDHTLLINFVNNEQEVIEKFQMFAPYFIGYYDFLSKDGSGFHYYYIGRKITPKAYE